MKKVEKQYQIHSYTTSNIDVFETICIHENLPISAYFIERREDFLLSLKKNPTFLNIIPRTKHVLNDFKLRTQYSRLYLFVVYILFVILTCIYLYVNNSDDIKVWMKVIKTETLNVGNTSQKIHLIWIILLFLLSLFIYKYIIRRNMSTFRE